ncbi:MAG: putative ATPase [Aureispira sp.]|jgi:predicted ATPase
MRQTTLHTTMKICKIIIKDYQQFQDFELDLTYPEGHEKAGEPLEKVCLIGSNGTGKSTLLEMMNYGISKVTSNHTDSHPKLIITYKGSGRFITVSYINNGNILFFKRGVEKHPEWNSISQGRINTESARLAYNQYQIFNNEIEDIQLKNNFTDLLIRSPSEGNQNFYRGEIPKVTVNDALKFLERFPFDHTISSDTLKDFWKLLIYLIKKRESDFLTFQKQEKNLDRTVRKVQEEFDKKSPKILNKIAELWDNILDKAGLEFDVEGASNPIQLNDNLQAYIRLKGTDKTIPYSQLSTGIRNFIFRVGHIFTLYFNRNIERGFLLLDEPENSLHPDFLYDLVDIYTGIIQNTQFFVATHNPIIAAQFEPYERFILEFDEQGAVHAKRGTTPVGDDPNDLLVQDFGVRNLLGKEGIKKWERYVELKNLIQEEEDKAKKVGLLEEFLSIGQAYNFPLQ